MCLFYGVLRTGHLELEVGFLGRPFGRWRHDVSCRQTKRKGGGRRELPHHTWSQSLPARNPTLRYRTMEKKVPNVPERDFTRRLSLTCLSKLMKQSTVSKYHAKKTTYMCMRSGAKLAVRKPKVFPGSLDQFPAIWLQIFPFALHLI